MPKSKGTLLLFPINGRAGKQKEFEAWTLLLMAQTDPDPAKPKRNRWKIGITLGVDVVARACVLKQEAFRTALPQSRTKVNKVI